jgi:elongation of very long chain fatty acids protein 6
MDHRYIASVLLATSNFLALPFERSFELTPYVTFARTNVRFPVAVIAVYVLLCFAGTHVMASRRPFDLRVPLAIWNAVLCVFSFVGMWRTMPRLVANILTMDYEQTICTSPTVGAGVEGALGWANGPTGFWVMLFIFSKLPELVDTAFIVLRKKPLIFLHWYHHVTVLLFCWNSYATTSGSGLYFVAMHYVVNTLMYGYYCLLALNLCPKSFPSFLITFAQIGQMFLGTFICLSGWYFKYVAKYVFRQAAAGPVCHNAASNLFAGAVMFGCYIYLFVDFSLKRQRASPAVGAPRRRVLKSVKAI